MEIVFLSIILFLFLLAIFDITVGVSNDAVNFMSSAIGSKAGSFKLIITIAAIGILVGAATSNGMMDIARHGILRPESFTFYEIVSIFMAVMVTDIVLLDIFNSLGMPTSTTVSMVFELLGATFAIAALKIATGDAVAIDGLVNTEKGLSVMIGIFLSVAIAFVAGTIVQFIARVLFSFDFNKRGWWVMGLYGGIATTAIAYFLIIKGINEMPTIAAPVKLWIADHTPGLMAATLTVMTLLMMTLRRLGVNTLKVVVLVGTFALAMAFAGNDLVNFIGVPLSGLSAYQDYIANGAAGPDTHMMGALNAPADTPLYMLLGAGVIMVVSLATSQKARHVTRTEISLGSQDGGDETFGSSRLARRLVRTAVGAGSWLNSLMPKPLTRWIDRRFDTTVTCIEPGAAFDLVRASVNMTLAAILIAVGTSMKLPLSTTFVTFMVAMGTSLADRAWGRESAVARITGVVSVIGGWLITAIIAFIGAGAIALLMKAGGVAAMAALGLAAVIVIVKSNRDFNRRVADNQADTLFQTILTTNDKTQAWELLRIFINERQRHYLRFAFQTYRDATQAFETENQRQLLRIEKSIAKEKAELKRQRRKETIALRRTSDENILAKSTWFHLSNNACQSINYNLMNITEAMREHVEHNYRQLPEANRRSFEPIRTRLLETVAEAVTAMGGDDAELTTLLREKCHDVESELSHERYQVYGQLNTAEADCYRAIYLYLNTLQESQELLSSLRRLLRASDHLNHGTTTKA